MATQYAVAGERFGMTHPDPVCLWLADMDIAPPGSVTDCLRDYLTGNSIGYQQCSVERAVRDWHRKQGGLLHNDTEVVDIHSIVSGVTLALSSLTPCESKVMVLAPTYPPLIDCVAQTGREIIVVPFPDADSSADTQKWDPTASALILCQPNNPTGQVLSDEQRQQIMRFCDQHNIVILSDEAHADLVFDGDTITPWSQLDPDASRRVVQFCSPNKTFNLAAYPGASYALISCPDYASLFRNAVSKAHMEAGTLARVCLIAAYQQADDWLNNTKVVLQDNRQWVQSYLATKLAGAAELCGDAGYFCWFDLAHLLGASHSDAWAKARDNGVLLADGKTFGVPGYARMTLATPKENLAEAFKRLGV